MGRRRRARHSESPRDWAQRVAGLPWVTLVLLAGLVVGGTEALRQDEFAAEATLSAPTWVDADRASVALSGPQLAAQVEEEVELEPGFRGDLRLTVAENDERLEVVVRAVSTDPRLAALAADTALALVLRANPEVDRGGQRLRQPGRYTPPSPARRFPAREDSTSSCEARRPESIMGQASPDRSPPSSPPPGAIRCVLPRSSSLCLHSSWRLTPAHSYPPLSPATGFTCSWSHGSSSPAR